MQQVIFKDAGMIRFGEAWKMQEEYFDKAIAVKIKNRNQPEKQSKQTHHFILCEHNPVITLGKNAKQSNILINEHFLQQHQIEKYFINRGGDVTFHGPGQLVGYPILDLDFFFTDIGKYLRSLEEVIINTLSAYGIHGERLPGATGVWLDAQNPRKARKICAIGIRCSRWVTMHGFALNVNTDLNYFNYIIPCGIQDKQVTSLAQELGEKQDIQAVKELLKKYFTEVFSCELISETY
jgi:lipoyl(octanoyl) transferase